MPLPRPITPNHPRATVLVAVIVVLIILTLAAVALSAAAARSTAVGADRISGLDALYAAEGVMNMAIREWAANADHDADGVVGSIALGNVASGPTISGARAAASIAVTGSDAVVTVSATQLESQRTLAASLSRSTGTTVPGLFTTSFTHANPNSTNSFTWTNTPQWMGISEHINLPNQGSSARWPGGPTGRYGVRWIGTVNIPSAGNWTFFSASDDGSLVFINGTRVVSNDGLHSNQTRSGTITLPAGPADFEARFFENGGSSNMQVSWTGPGVPSTVLIPASRFSCAPTAAIPGVAAHTSITIGNNAVVDGYDSRSGPYSAGTALSDQSVSVNSTVAAAISMTSSARISGNALVGPGGNPSTGISTSSSATISGARSTLASRIAVPLPGLPAGIPASSGALSINSNTIIASNTRVSSMSVNNSSVITVSGEVVLVCDGDVSFNGSSSLNIPSGSRLTLYVYGTFSVNNDVILNSNGDDPTRLRIIMLGSSRAFTASSNTVVRGSLFNPNGSVTLSNFAVFSGSVVCNTFSMDSESRMRIDAALLSGSGGSSGATLSAWRQLN